jgi:hypothetical protein
MRYDRVPQYLEHWEMISESNYRFDITVPPRVLRSPTANVLLEAVGNVAVQAITSVTAPECKGVVAAV